MFKKLIISVFLIFALTGGAYADKGADMPGGKFSIGEYGRDTYKNGWMGLSFTADKKLRNNSLGADKLVFYTTDEEALKRLDARDFDQAWAFSYALQRLSGTLHLYVVNLEKEQQNLGVVKDRDDYLDKLIAYINEDNKVLSPKLSEVYDTVLGGRSFKAFDMAVLGGEMLKRYYVQQIDGFLVVVEMVAAKNSNTNEELLAEYAACFTKYDAGQPSEPQNTPALDMGEYFDDGYRNAWLDVTFKAPQGYKGAFKEAAHGYLQFSDTDSQTLKLISRGDYSEIYAFTYQTTNPIGGVDMLL